MVDANKARGNLEDILNTKEYRVYNEPKGFIQTWWENAKQWLAEQLEKLFPAIKSASSASGPILIVIIVIGLILLGFLAFFVIRNTRRNVKLRKQNPLQSLKKINWTYGQHLNAAGKYELSKEFARSTRHLFLALLLYLHEQGWLETRIWKTNWDYFDELRKVNQQKAEQFYRLAHFFDEVTYGERMVSKEEYEQFKTFTMVWLSERGEEGS